MSNVSFLREDDPPAPWKRVNYDNNSEVDNSFKFLKDTYDWRYQNLEKNDFRKKTKPRENPPKGRPSVRSFVVISEDKLTMCAHFFLRHGNSTSYSLSIGVAENIEADDLYAELKKLCKYLLDVQGPPKIEVINERPLPHDLKEGDHNSSRSRTVGDAFKKGLDDELFEEDFPVRLKHPWPAVVYRYAINTDKLLKL